MYYGWKPALGVIVMAWSCATVGQNHTKVPATTLCSVFKQPAMYDGKMVRVRAVYSGSFEGAYLFDGRCRKAVWFTTPEGNRNVAAVLIHNPYPKIEDVKFALVKDAQYEKFVTYSLQPEYKVTGTFSGRIDHCKHFRLDPNGFGNGFGQMGQSEFQFIMQSVSNVVAEKARDVLVPELSTKPDRLPEKH